MICVTNGVLSVVVGSLTNGELCRIAIIIIEKKKKKKQKAKKCAGKYLIHSNANYTHELFGVRARRIKLINYLYLLLS